MEAFLRGFKSNLLKLIKESSSINLLKTLSAIEYAEAILEITTAKLFGEKFKWFLIFLLQLTKCVIRLRLLILHKIGIQPLPPLFNLNGFLKSAKEKEKEIKNKKTSFKLKHSGRQIRTIENAPSNLADRDWTVPVETIDFDETTTTTSLHSVVDERREEDHYDPNLNRQRFLAELLHILRPTAHLVSLIVFNSRSWKQFLVPFTMDLASLLLMNGTKNLSETQKKEMKRRTFIFLYYFIRSPIYERFSSSIINVGLSQFEQRLPGAKYIAKPIKDYIPYWRSIYSYCWSV